MVYIGLGVDIVDGEKTVSVAYGQVGWRYPGQAGAQGICWTSCKRCAHVLSNRICFGSIQIDVKYLLVCQSYN